MKEILILRKSGKKKLKMQLKDGIEILKKKKNELMKKKMKKMQNESCEWEMWTRETTKKDLKKKEEKKLHWKKKRRKMKERQEYIGERNEGIILKKRTGSSNQF